MADTMTVQDSGEWLDILFEDASGPQGGAFVEVEDYTGKSIKLGDWVKRPDGYWALRIFKRSIAGAPVLTHHGFINRVRSLYNIDHHLLPELSDQDWKEFRDNPPRYYINSADCIQADAIWREIERRQQP